MHEMVVNEESDAATLGKREKYGVVVKGVSY
jgi:hypothetical protein